jgi:methylsterol monooxygenase
MWHVLLEHLAAYWGGALALRLAGFDTSAFRRRDGLLVLFNQVCVTPIVFFAMCPPQFPTRTPGVDAAAAHIILYYVVFCALFYGFHRLLHLGAAYRHVHRFHHKHRDPCPWAALYCHPVEHALTNAAAVFAGPAIWHPSVLTFRIWVLLGTVSSLTSHSHELVCGPHVTHHRNLKVNFGVGTWLDRAFGTYLGKTDQTSVLHAMG